MIFVDANVPMYLVGGDHPNKTTVMGLLPILTATGEQFVTDVEVYQEILHRYHATQRREVVDAAFEALDDLVSSILVFERDDVLEANDILDSAPGLSARDAIHIAVMRKAGVNRILSFDRGFDAFREVERVS